MSQRIRIVQTINMQWAKAGMRTRLAAGAVLVATIGLMGLTPNVLFGATLKWPYAALIAAAGWGRSGLAFGPMVLLIMFGFAQDVTSDAPLGSFALVNLLAFGACAGLSQTFDAERSPGVNFGIPIAIIVLGFVLVFIISSLAGGHITTLMPLFLALIGTLLLNVLIAPVFDLGVRRGLVRGGAI